MTPELERNTDDLEEKARGYMAAQGYEEYQKEVCPVCIFTPEAMRPAPGDVMHCPCGTELHPGKYLTFQAFRKKGGN